MVRIPRRATFCRLRVTYAPFAQRRPFQVRFMCPQTHTSQPAWLVSDPVIYLHPREDTMFHPPLKFAPARPEKPPTHSRKPALCVLLHHGLFCIPQTERPFPSTPDVSLHGRSRAPRVPHREWAFLSQTFCCTDTLWISPSFTHSSVGAV